MKNKKYLIAGLLALLLIAGGVFLRVKNDKIIEQQNQQNQQNQNNQVDNELVWYEIPELGVRFKISKEISMELVYIYKQNNDFKSVSFSTKRLSLIDGCGAGSSDSPLGTLVKINGKPEEYKEKDYYRNRLIKQLDGYFIIKNGPQAFCAMEKNDIITVEEYFKDNPEILNWSQGFFEAM